MKLLILVLLTVSSSWAYEKIDWSIIRPVEEFPAFKAALEANFRQKSLNIPIKPAIVNGEIAKETPRQFPFQVAVLARFDGLGDGLCGGSILTTRTVLTAAHCIDLNRVSDSALIVVGAHNIRVEEPTQVRTRVPNSAYLVHEQWDLSRIANDIATIQMPAENAFVFNLFVRPVSLPSRMLTDNFEGQSATIAGWGVISDATQQTADELRFITRPVMRNLNCNLRFPGIIQSSHICLDGSNRQSACSGDSGGPLTIARGEDHIQIGIVSFGLGLGCELTWPGVFVRVTSFYSWINDHTI